MWRGGAARRGRGFCAASGAAARRTGQLCGELGCCAAEPGRSCCSATVRGGGRAAVRRAGCGAADGAAARRMGLLQCHGAGRTGGRGQLCGEWGCRAARAGLRGCSSATAEGAALRRAGLLRGEQGCCAAGGAAARRAGMLRGGRGCGWWGSFAAGGGSCAESETFEATARQTELLRRGGQCFCGAEGAAARLLRAGLLRGTARRARMRQGGRSICGAAHRGLDDTTRMLDVDGFKSI